MQKQVLVITTLETKRDESAYLCRCLRAHGVESRVLDVSLHSHGAVFSGEEKLAAIDKVASETSAQLRTAVEHLEVQAVLGLGGGTGGEIILRAMRELPITFPKVLVTTLPFDPRIALADNSIILVPTLADICGMNATLRQVFENAASMTAGLCGSQRYEGACVEDKSIGITALGATGQGVDRLVQALRASARDSTVFHANGFGGAAFTRFIDRGSFYAAVDLTTHEITRILLGGAHVEMPRRFLAAGDQGLAQVVLPGGINFIGLGDLRLLPSDYLKRPHYQHTGMFTHVQLTTEEMCQVSDALIAQWNQSSVPMDLIVPMGGFSHQDCSGGAIESMELRQVFLERVQQKAANHIQLHVSQAHINDPTITHLILQKINAYHAQSMGVLEC